MLKKILLLFFIFIVKAVYALEVIDFIENDKAIYFRHLNYLDFISFTPKMEITMKKHVFQPTDDHPDYSAWKISLIFKKGYSKTPREINPNWSEISGIGLHPFELKENCKLNTKGLELSAIGVNLEFDVGQTTMMDIDLPICTWKVFIKTSEESILRKNLSKMKVDQYYLQFSTKENIANDVLAFLKDRMMAGNLEKLRSVEAYYLTAFALVHWVEPQKNEMALPDFSGAFMSLFSSGHYFQLRDKPQRGIYRRTINDVQL